MKKLLKFAVIIIMLQSIVSKADNIKDEYDNFVARTNEFNAAMKECYGRIDATENGKIVNNEIIFNNINSTNKFALSINTNKLNEAQKEVLKQYLSDAMNCRNKTNEKLERLPIFYSLYMSYRNNIDAVFVQLLKGEITIGDANTKKSELASKLLSDIAQANNDYMKSLNDRASANTDRRQRAAETLIPYLQNNKPIQLQPYQMQFNPGINTNCSTYGNQTNCTSR